MSRWLEDAGERHSFYRVAFISLASCTVFAVMVSMLLMDQKKIGLPGAGGILLIGWVTAGVITTLVWTVSGVVSRGVVQTMTGAGNLAPAPSFSLQESMVARGRYQDAASSYQEHLEQHPGDFHAQLALAALCRDHLGDAGRAERLLLEARRKEPPPNIEFAIGNSLIDLYHRTGQRGRELVELARFAARHRGTPEGVRAREALARIKAEDG